MRATPPPTGGDLREDHRFPSMLQDVSDTGMEGKAGTEVVRTLLMLRVLWQGQCQSKDMLMARGKQAWDLRQGKIHDPHSSYRFSCLHSTC